MNDRDAETHRGQVTVRGALPSDVEAVVRFGEDVIPAHYAPLIGVAAARSQVEQWWNTAITAEAVAAAVVVVGEVDGHVVAVGQRGRWEGEHVVWKLYVHPSQRGRGLGPRLLEALVAQLPEAAERIWIEHVAANTRAGAFYEREGFTVAHVVDSPTGEAAAAQVWRVRQLHGTRCRGHRH